MRPPKDLPSFLQDDDIDSDTLLDVTMNDGSRFTGTIGDISSDWERMEWHIVTGRTQGKRRSEKIVVPIRSIVSATQIGVPLGEPRLPVDPFERTGLNGRTFSMQSTLLFALAIALGLPTLYFYDVWWPAYWPIIVAVAYTAAVLIGTFASVKFGAVLPEIPLMRPEVRVALPRLLLIHAGFLAACLLIMGFAIAIHPWVPAWMNERTARGSTVFTFGIGLAIFAIVSKQVSINRRDLENAKSAVFTGVSMSERNGYRLHGEND